MHFKQKPCEFLSKPKQNASSHVVKSSVLTSSPPKTTNHYFEFHVFSSNVRNILIKMFPKTKTCKLKSAGWKEKHHSKVLQGSSRSLVCLFKSWTWRLCLLLLFCFFEEEVKHPKKRKCPWKTVLHTICTQSAQL